MLLAMSRITTEAERQILSELFNRYYGVMLKEALSICTAKHEAEDVVIEAMMALFDKASLLDTLNDYECATYLVRTVERKAYKHNKAAWCTKVDSLHEKSFIPAEETYINPELLLCMKEQKREIAIALMKLSERDQILLDCIFYEKMSYAEIAKFLNLSLSNVKQSLYRARRRALFLLKEVLENET